MSCVTEPSIVFRPDASFSTGSGHVVRCLALAAALTRRGASCAFAVTEEALAAVPALASAGHRLLPLAAGDDAAALASALPKGTDWLVVDHYGLGAAYEARCRPWARRILAIDDLPRRLHGCDLLLDQTLNRHEESYRPWVPADCRVLTGTSHALLRPAFAARRAEALAGRRDPVERILVCFGGGDPEGITEPIALALAEALPGVTVDVVIGPHWPEAAAQAARLTAHSRVVVHCDPPDMAGLMVAADLAVGAAGSMSWERCALGLPAVVVVAADNQEAIAQALAAAGAARVTAARPAAIVAAVAELVDDAVARAAMVERAAGICDGGGADRVAAAMVEVR